MVSVTLKQCHPTRAREIGMRVKNLNPLIAFLGWMNICYRRLSA